MRQAQVELASGALRGLTVLQPWATAIAEHGKDVENRSRASHYRGPLLIHAGKQYAKPDAWAHVRLCSGKCPGPHPPAGQIVAVTEQFDCARVVGHTDGWFLRSVDGSTSYANPMSQWVDMGDNYHYLLRQAQPLKPMPYRGAQGFWKPDPALLGDDLLAELAAWGEQHGYRFEAAGTEVLWWRT